MAFSRYVSLIIKETEGKITMVKTVIIVTKMLSQKQPTEHLDI